ncbi:MAG: DUF1501 domain-containing protein [Planctomycetales bacterium]
MDVYYRRAFDVLTSSKLVEAMNVEKEDARTRALYSGGSPQHLGDGAPMWNDQLLMARRLVEAGVRCVTVGYGFWDTYGNNFAFARTPADLRQGDRCAGAGYLRPGAGSGCDGRCLGTLGVARRSTRMRDGTTGQG